MVICDVEDDARRIGGFTYFLRTPDDFEPVLWIYFTHLSRVIVLQAVHASE